MAFGLEKIKIFHREKVAPSAEIAQKALEHYGLATPTSSEEFVPFVVQLLRVGDIVGAYQFALDLPVHYDNFHKIQSEVVHLAGGYSPHETISERSADALLKISKLPIAERQNIATPKRRVR